MPPLTSCEGWYRPQDSFTGIQMPQWHSSTVSSRADSLLWTTTISSVIFSVSPSHSKCGWKTIQKSSSTSQLSPTLPPDSGMTSLKRWQILSLSQLFVGNSRLTCFQITIIDLSVFFSVCVFFLAFIWQRDYSMSFPWMFWGLYKLTIFIIILI